MKTSPGDAASTNRSQFSHGEITMNYNNKPLQKFCLIARFYSIQIRYERESKK